MSIRTKLILSYAAMFLVPLALILLVSLLLILAFQGSVQNARNLYERTESLFDRDEIGHAIHEIERTIRHDPAILGNDAFLKDVSDELAQSGTGFVLRKDDRIVYVSDNLRGRSEIAAVLPPYRKDGYKARLPTVRVGSDYYIGKRYDFALNDRSRNTFLIWTRMDPAAYFARQYFPLLFAILLVVLVLTHALLTRLMSRTIIRPLLQLKNAATRIKEGNLDFQIDLGGRDEIGQLGAAFEDMRSQLQKSLALQQQYEDNRKALISSISHDLKTPITAIRGYVDGLLEGVADTPEKTERYLRTISAKAEEMDRLIDELFLYAKLDLKRVPFALEPVRLAGFMADWAEELHFELEKRQVGIETSIELPAQAEVMLDRDQFRRVLSNIVANSLKYMDKPDKKLHLSVFREGDRAIVALRDNGAGIAADALPHIFERFYREETSRNTQTGGTGLGLAIAKQIMDGHGGSIEAQSVKGQGTTLRIGLPLRVSGEGRESDDQTHLAH
jgi:signal transduction histidine kinase